MAASRADTLLQHALQLFGLQAPTVLARTNDGYLLQPLAGQVALVASSADSNKVSLSTVLMEAGARVVEHLDLSQSSEINLVVFDACAWQTLDELNQLYKTFHQLNRQIARNGRVIIVYSTLAEGVIQPTLTHAIQGFIRSLAKELGAKGICVNGIQSPSLNYPALEGALRFLAGKESVFVSGQTLIANALSDAAQVMLTPPALANKKIVVTGASRGIGLATVKRLRQEGATVIGVDVAACLSELEARCSEIGAQCYGLDITDQSALVLFLQHIEQHWGALDGVVHNAGITRDKSLAKMTQQNWQAVLAVNLQAVVHFDDQLLAHNLLTDQAHIVCLSSMSGIAGNFGQTNYATSKAGLMGYVSARARQFAGTARTINAVAPGFIDTAMTQKMPWLTRNIAQRMNSLKQAGLPEDVAQAIVFFSSGQSQAFSGNTLRVCGQNLIGA